MKFLSIFTPDANGAMAGPPSAEHQAAMGKLIEQSMKSGELIMTGAVNPISKGGGAVRKSGGNTTLLDGPFAESKEVVAGWAILQYKTRDEAIEGMKRFLQVAGDGVCEFQQIMD